MKNIEFGDYIYTLRTNANLSQSELGKMVNVSNKAISKWENGNAYPTSKTLSKLSKIFGVSIDEMFKAIESKSERQITKIAITGGPCAGKSTALSWINEEFTKKGYKVLFVPETATELITGGVAPWTCETDIDFQTAILKLQLAKEEIFEEVAQHLYDAQKVLIVCDRGTLDGKAYIEKHNFDKILNNLHLTETQLKDSYDAVFHLVTAAKGASEFYTLANNSARTETIEEAIANDDKIISAWTGHSHFRVIDNSTDFKKKMQRFVTEISNFLGEPTPYEIERKFLIEYPDIAKLEADKNCGKVEIIQTYLKSNDDKEIRVRQRGNNGSYSYTKTIKQTINGLKRLETEKRLTQAEYINLLMDADTTKHQIRKTRYCLVYNNQYFEIDIYPFWNDVAIMEIELNNESQTIEFPPQIKIIKEVTDDIEYKNSNLANIKQ
ncbi:MAG: AAA family ATPase [Eubacteriales bacterium]|nr:AAA family ATPase [Eubacteriales bacterium]